MQYSSQFFFILACRYYQLNIKYAIILNYKDSGNSKKRIQQ